MVDQELCKSCGTPASPGAKFCESCGAPLEEGMKPTQPETLSQPQPEQYGEPHQPTTDQGYQAPPLQYKSVGIRFVAILIDSIIIGIIGSIVTLPLGAMTAVSVNAETQAISIPTAYWVGIIIELIIAFLYFTVLEGRYGQTVGKIALRLKVLKEDGLPINYGDAAIRTILRVVDEIPFIVPYLLGAILIWSSDRKQRLGDRVAHTVVVRV
jgi:uncharacterized RDD family membrane protein YckC